MKGGEVPDGENIVLSRLQIRVNKKNEVLAETHISEQFRETDLIIAQPSFSLQNKTDGQLNNTTARRAP